jgi:hypothetical protein
MTENQEKQKNENEEINDLLKHLQESQGEGDSLFMFRQPTIDETQVDEALLQEMVEIDNMVTAKIHEWGSRHISEVLRNTSIKHQINGGFTNLSNLIDETKVNQSLLQEMTDFEEFLNVRTSGWGEKYDTLVIENTTLKYHQM